MDMAHSAVLALSGLSLDAVTMVAVHPSPEVDDKKRALKRVELDPHFREYNALLPINCCQTLAHVYQALI